MTCTASALLVGFSVDVERHPGSATVTMRGELDLATRDHAERVCTDRGLLHSTVTLDLRELTFVDSRGVRLLTGLDARCRAAGCRMLVLPPTSGTAARMMALQHLERRLTYIEPPVHPAA